MVQARRDKVPRQAAEWVAVQIKALTVKNRQMPMPITRTKTQVRIYPGEALVLAREEQEQEEAKAKVWDDKTALVVVVETWKVPLPSFLKDY